jgi:hypothetical protein
VRFAASDEWRQIYLAQLGTHAEVRGFTEPLEPGIMEMLRS